MALKGVRRTVPCNGITHVTHYRAVDIAYLYQNIQNITHELTQRNKYIVSQTDGYKSTSNAQVLKYQNSTAAVEATRNQMYNSRNL